MQTETITTSFSLTEQEICEKYHITLAQLERATRILNAMTGEIWYQVESQTTLDTVYEVHFNADYRCFTCTCPAGNPPLINGHLAYAPRPCWHKRAAAACAYEHRQAENLAYRKEAEAARLARVRAERDARYAELARQRDEARASVAGLKAGKGVRQSTPFSLLA